MEPESGTLFINGTAINSAEVDYEAPAYNPSKIVISGYGSSEGTVYIDEIHLSDSLPSLGAGGSGEAEWRYPGEILALGEFPLLSNFRIYQLISASTRQFASGFLTGEAGGDFRSLTETDINIAVFKISLTADLLYSAPLVYISGGHRILFPVQLDFVSISDGYRENNSPGGSDFTKSSSLSLQFPEAVSISLDQESSSAGTVPFPAVEGGPDYTADNSVLLFGKLCTKKTSEEFQRSYIQYFSNWGRSYAYFLPYTGYPYPELTWDTALALSVTTEPVGVSAEHSLGFKQFGKSQRLQRDTALFSISLPLVFQAGTPLSWSIIPAYKREMSAAGTVSFGLGFPRSFSVFGGSYRRQRYFYAAPPYFELFDTATFASFSSSSTGYENASYYPEASVTLSRNAGSSIYNLFLPSEGSIAFGRNCSREQEEVTDEREWKFRLRNTAINLFGRLGAYPVFYFYESEEFSTIIDLTFDLTSSYVLDGVETAVQNILFMQGAKAWEFTLENRLDFLYTPSEEDRFATSDTLSLGFRWDVPAAFDLPLTFIPEKNRTALFFRSTETVESTLGPRFSGESGGFDISILVSHQTKLIVPETGFISAELALGFDKSSPYMWYMGLQGGIEGKISF